jgi:hypothetical protein
LLPSQPAATTLIAVFAATDALHSRHMAIPNRALIAHFMSFVATWWGRKDTPDDEIDQRHMSRGVELHIHVK